MFNKKTNVTTVLIALLLTAPSLAAGSLFLLIDFFSVCFTVIKKNILVKLVSVVLIFTTTQNLIDQ